MTHVYFSHLQSILIFSNSAALQHIAIAVCGLHVALWELLQKSLDRVENLHLN